MKKFFVLIVLISIVLSATFTPTMATADEPIRIGCQAT